MDFELEQIVIKTAFLNGELNEEIYMEIPPIPDVLMNKMKSKEWSFLMNLFNINKYG